jgi:hypothetical protein
MHHIATGRALSPGENYSLLIIGDSNVGGDGGEVDGDAEEATTSMEMAPGALPRPGRVPEQRLLSPKIRWWRRRG